MRNITFKITTDNQKPLKDGTYHLKLRIKTPIKYIQRSGVFVKAEHWDDSYGNIKQEFVSKYPNASKFINEIYSRVEDIRQPLHKNEISIKTAYDILKGLNVIKGSVLEFASTYEPDAKTGQSTIDKHIANLKAINTGLSNNGMKQYDPIEFSHMQDESCIDDIATVIKTKMRLATNTQSSYMKSLNWVCKKAKLKLINPFTHFGYMVTEIASGKNEPISNHDLQLGYNNIRTLHQFEALCFWLYSFCLMGLDGRDIAGLSEDNIITKGYKRGDLRDYIPDADVLGNKDYSKPLHVHIKRGKTRRGATDSGVDAIFQVNLFPTLVVLELLKHTIKHNVNGYAYEGSDRLKLYNFDIDTQEGYKKWADIRNTYTSQMNKKVGTTTQQARHTVTNVAGQLGLTQEDVDSLLNHTIKGVNKHYWTKQQTQTDVSHTHIFQQYDIIEMVKNLLEMFKDRVEVIGNTEVPFIPKSIMTQTIKNRRVTRVHRLQMFDLGLLTKFSREDEIKYHTLLKEALQGQTILKDGKMQNVPIDEKDYPKELQDLIEKRKQVYVKPPKLKYDWMSQELLDKIDISTSAVQDDSPQVAKAKEILKLDES